MALLLSEFLKTVYIPQAHIIGRGVLPVGGKMILAGSPKANKSWVAMNMMLDIVRGRRCFDATYKRGLPVLPVAQPWRVLYLEQELGEQGLLERLNGTEAKDGLVSGICADGLPLYVHTRDTAMRLDAPEGRDFINGLVKETKPDVVVFDPMAKFHLSNENDSQEMGAVMRVADHIVEDHGCAVVFVHHIGKQDPDPEKQKRGGDRLRGSSAIFADVDTLCEVTRMSNEHHPEPILKMDFTLRRGEPIETLFVQRFRDGHIEWLGEGVEFDQPAKKERLPRGRYPEL